MRQSSASTRGERAMLTKSKESISTTLSTARASAARPRSQATSDEALMGRIAEGDRLAMEVLYARHHVRVFRFSLRLIGDESLAEDLATEVFLDVWRHADRFEGRSAVSTWVLGIARFKALSARRRRAAEQLDDEVAKTIEDPADDPARVLEKNGTSAVIRNCLKRLAPHHREIIDLAYYHEKSLAEVAAIVGVPKNTVKTRMLRARTRLAGLLKDAGIGRDCRLQRRLLPMSPAYRAHPEFGYFCPSRRFRRKLLAVLAVIALGALASAVVVGGSRESRDDASPPPAPVNAASSSAATTSAVDQATAAAARPGPTESPKPVCEGETWTYLDGKCIAGKAQKPRIAAIDSPPIAAIPLGRTSPPPEAPPAKAERASEAAAAPPAAKSERVADTAPPSK